MVLSYSLHQYHVFLSSPSEPRGPLYLPQNCVVLFLSLQNRMVLSSLHQSCLILSLLPQNHMVLPPMAAVPGFKSQCQSSSAAPFPTPPTISYTCQHSPILPTLLGSHNKSGQVWPHGMEPIISKLSHRPCNQGAVSYTHLTLPTSLAECRSRWSPYH